MLKLIKRIIRKNRVISIAAIISITAGIVIILIGMTFYKNRIASFAASDTVNYHNYKAHYAIISEESDATFWKAIYQGALEMGKRQDIYVEKIGSSLSVSYSLEDMMRIAISSKVDGIIIEPNGEENITELINEAEEIGIPVITVLRDAPESQRKSFVGINSYNQGQTYGKQVLEVAAEGKRKVTVLLNSDDSDTTQNTIYSNISEMVGDADVELESATVSSQSIFGSVEDIRNIIMDQENPPEVLVCLTAVDTYSAYNAVVDYNKAGVIDIIGYYDSDLILTGIEMDNIHSTMTIDAKQMGAYCVEALTEYRQTGQVSDYFSIDISVINYDNIKEYRKMKSIAEKEKQK
ncbi:MAG TPA: substrate-binding domain-containing protein [Mobilitalea sp.]|nr:substrate-binding domain-containing protein [Mobilitalea sp.]